MLLVMLYAVHRKRSSSAAYGRAFGEGSKTRILRETRPDLLCKHRPFTDEEEQFIRQNCKQMTVGQVASLLKRKRGCNRKHCV
jgi:hypothetical protein